MPPTLRQLQYLVLLAEHGSFRRAAEAARVSQPTLSAGVRELERVLGAPVVDRSRSPVLLTPVGEAASARARDVLARTEDLVEAARVAGRPLAGRFRLGVIPTVAPFLLPAAMPRLRARFPELRLFLREDLTANLLAELKAGALDAVLIALPYDAQGLETAPVSRDALLALLPAAHPLARAPAVAAGALETQELVLLEDGHCLREQALAVCSLDARDAGGASGFSAASLHTLVQMVASGLGVSLLPAMAAEAGLAAPDLVAVRPLEEGASREVVVAWREGSSRAHEARLLAETLREPAQSVSSPPRKSARSS